MKRACGVCFSNDTYNNRDFFNLALCKNSFSCATSSAILSYTYIGIGIISYTRQTRWHTTQTADFKTATNIISRTDRTEYIFSFFFLSFFFIFRIFNYIKCTIKLNDLFTYINMILYNNYINSSTLKRVRRTSIETPRAV